MIRWMMVLSLSLGCTSKGSDTGLMVTVANDADADTDTDTDSDSDSDTDTDTDSDTDSDTNTDTDTDTDTGTDTGSGVSDADGDGHSVADGDCNDDDDTIFPGADDSECNGIDNDCDDWPDDEWGGDWYEPNDLEGYNLGAIDGEVYSLENGAIHPEIDQDRFRFWVTDHGGAFLIEVTLEDVPGTADLALELYFIEDEEGVGHGLVSSSDSTSLGGSESVSTRDWIFGSQTGWYEVAVTSSSGSSCTDTYMLTINANSR